MAAAATTMNSRERARKLSALKPGEVATIERLCGRGHIVQRLYEMGLLEGHRVEMVRHTPFGGPVEICVCDYHLSLRRDEADLVEIT